MIGGNESKRRMPATSRFRLSFLYVLLAIATEIRFSDCWIPARSTRLNKKTALDAVSELPVSFFNTLTRTKEKFEAIKSPTVTFYSCGPTVYDFAHVGNFRAFLTYDLVKRWLTYCGYEVDHIMNLTDIDDKIIVKLSQSEGETLKSITNKYADAFFDDLKVLNIVPARRYPRATEHIDDIDEMVAKLVDLGNAYASQSSDSNATDTAARSASSSVYFRVSSMQNYGSKLANLKFDDMVKGAGGFGPNERRGTEDKENPRDFALWKAYTPQDGEVVWDSKRFGKGRPGWHIECSAMCKHYLGETIDIHAGGVDLVFPHHTNEIAQSEAYTGKEFSRFWIHNGFVNIDNEKMSKSLKNFKTLREVVSAPEDARAFRYMVVSSQYRNPLNFNAESLKAAKACIKRIDRLVAKLQGATSSLSSISATESSQSLDAEEQALLDGCKSDFDAAMCDDLNTPRACAALFRLIGATEKRFKNTVTQEPSDASSDSSLAAYSASALQLLSRMDSVLGVIYEVPATYFQQSQNVVAASSDREDDISNARGELTTTAALTGVDSSLDTARSLAEKRLALKVLKQFQEADAVRDEITKLGYGVKDKKDGFDLIKL